MHTTTTPSLTIAEPTTFDATAFATQALSSAAALAAVLDHTLLKPEATRAQVIRLCHEAAEHRFACAMVNPTWVGTAAETLAGTGVPVGVVIAFPLGASLAASKCDEAKRVVKLGAHDVDMVLNIGLLKSGSKDDFEAVKHDIHGVVEIAHGNGAIVKVIIETCLLSFEEKLRASELALAAGADFIKTSTGFSSGGATVDDITLMRSPTPPPCSTQAPRASAHRQASRSSPNSPATRPPPPPPTATDTA
jgi:deoxyribose-phosphate aldolase